MPVSKRLIRVGHSPDPDDAFMFYALAAERIDTGPFRFVHELCDIETLNRRAFEGELELTAVSFHAYAFCADKYLLCRCGASVGDGYGPMIVVAAEHRNEWHRGIIAVPGTFTTAFLALRLFLQRDFEHVVVPFDQIIAAVAQGHYQGRRVDAGLIIHEGQLTYDRAGLTCAVDLGVWWKSQTGLPLPLGGNAIRADLQAEDIVRIHQLLSESIAYGLAHRAEALEYAMRFGRDLDRGETDRFVGMYVNDWTLDLGPRGVEAVDELFSRARAAGVIPRDARPRFIEENAG